MTEINVTTKRNSTCSILMYNKLSPPMNPVGTTTTYHRSLMYRCWINKKKLFGKERPQFGCFRSEHPTTWLPPSAKSIIIQELFWNTNFAKNQNHLLPKERHQVCQFRPEQPTRLSEPQPSSLLHLWCSYLLKHDCHCVSVSAMLSRSVQCDLRGINITVAGRR